MHIDLSSAVLIDPLVLLTIVGMLFPFWRAIGRHIRRLDNMLRDWNGEPARDGVEERPGVMNRLSKIEGHLATIDHELSFNSGTSVKDAVHRTDATVKALSEDLSEHMKKT